LEIFKSRFTPGLKNGADVSFVIGEKVKYLCWGGEIINITIYSYLMKNSGYLGYESIFHDDDKIYFAIAEQIIDWEGKINS